MEKKGEGSVRTQVIGKLFRAIRGFLSNALFGCNLSGSKMVCSWWKRSCVIWAGALSIWLLIFVSTPVRAQVLFGSVVGAVTDASGAAVPGATVKITNMQTSNQRTA